MPDTISTSGAAFKNTAGQGATTVSVTPAALGNSLVLAVEYAGTSNSIATVAGGGCPTSGSGTAGQWVKLGGPFRGSAYSTDLWLGAVTSGVGSAQTITVTGASSLSTTTMALSGQQFTVGGGAGSTWAIDGTAGTVTNSTSSTTVTFPTLTPGGTLRAYVGFVIVQNTGSATGTTSGYTVTLDGQNNPLIVNASVANSAQTPACTQSPAGTSFGLAALITGTKPVTTSARGQFFLLG